MDNNLVIPIPIQLDTKELWPRYGFRVCVHCDLDLGVMTLGQGMTHRWVMDNNCTNYYPDPTWQWRVMARTLILCISALWPWPWRYDLGSRSWHILGSWTTIVRNIIQIQHGSEELRPGHEFGYVCTVTLTLEVWPWLKVMTYPWVMDNNCVKYYPDPTWQWGVMALTRILGMCALWLWSWRYDIGSRSWHILGSWTIIVWNIIQIGQGVKKLWPGHDVNRRTDRQTDGQTDRVIPIYSQTLFAGGMTDRVIPIYPSNFVCGGIINIRADKRLGWQFMGFFWSSRKTLTWKRTLRSCFLSSLVEFCLAVAMSEWEWDWLLNVTCNDISVIYVTAYRCAGGLKKLDLRSGSQRHRHIVGFFNVPV